MMLALVPAALLCVLAGMAMAATGPESETSSVYWDDQFPMLGADSKVLALAKDGAGNVYIGGSFHLAGNFLANHVAKWNAATSTWSAMGTGMNDNVNALAVDGLGNVYAGGHFSTAGGVTVNCVAKWDGTAWSALGTGLNDEVEALVVDGSGNVFAGGWFTTAGGVTANHVAKWNGSAWSALGTGTNALVLALAADGSGNVYAGGQFTTADDLPAKYIAKWDGSAWSAMGTGMGDWVYALAADGSGNVYAGGFFSVAGGVSASHVARWDGSGWFAMGTGMAGSYPVVYALALDGAGNVCAGGGFTMAGGAPADLVARWDGTAWSPLGTGMSGSGTVVVYALAADKSGKVCAGGSFSIAGSVKAEGAAQWDGASWSALGAGINDTVGALAADGAGNVYAGGAFGTAGGGTASHIAKWNGAAWSELGTGMNGAVRALVADKSGKIYAGGAFTTANSLLVNQVAQWDGVSWRALKAGVAGPSSEVFALAMDGAGNLYAGGRFTTADGASANRVAKWNGTAWSAMGTGTDGNVYALATDGAGNVYVGGYFTTAGGVTVNAVARWNGSKWFALGSGMDNTVQALAVDSAGNLYAGGLFTTAGGVTVNHIAKWNGSVWSALGSGTTASVYALALDGVGKLYSGGGVTTISGVSTASIAQWNGSAWSALGTGGLNNTVYALAVNRNALFAGGDFTKAGGTVSGRFAEWQPRVNQSTLSLTAAPGALTLGNDNYGFLRPALTTQAGTTVTHAGGLPVTVTLDRADEIQVDGNRVSGALALGPTSAQFGGAGATLRVEFSEDDVAAYGVAYTEFRAAALGYPGNYPTSREAASLTGLGTALPAPIRIDNGKQIYAITVPLAATGLTGGAVPIAYLTPAAPTNPGATDFGTNSITWTWQDNSLDETGFKVWADAGTGAPVTLVATTAENANYCPYGGLSPNAQCAFQTDATNGVHESGKTAVFSAWTLARTPVAPVVGGATLNALNVAIGAGDGNPTITEYAVYCTTTGQWMQADGTLGATTAWQTAAAWGTKAVGGFAQAATCAFTVTARNGAAVETAAGPSASGTTLDAAPTAVITRVTTTPTSSDRLVFTVLFNEPVGGSFIAARVRVVGTLAGTAAVSGADPNYTVSIALANRNADGTCGINIPAGKVTDLTGHFYAGGSSSLCTVQNWSGFLQQPQDAKLYVGDNHTFTVQVNEGGLPTTYRWKFNNGSALTDGAAAAQWPLTNVSLAAAGSYWCRVTCGGVLHVGDVATVQVQPHVQITTAPTGGEVTEGGGFSFTVTATGGYGPLAYQWKKDGVAIGGANDSQYALVDLSVGDSGQYSVEVSDTNTDIIESTPVTLTVDPRVPAAGLGGLALLAVALAAGAGKRRR